MKNLEFLEEDLFIEKERNDRLELEVERLKMRLEFIISELDSKENKKPLNLENAFSLIDK